MIVVRVQLGCMLSLYARCLVGKSKLNLIATSSICDLRSSLERLYFVYVQFKLALSFSPNRKSNIQKRTLNSVEYEEPDLLDQFQLFFLLFKKIHNSQTFSFSCFFYLYRYLSFTSDLLPFPIAVIDSRSFLLLF